MQYRKFGRTEWQVSSIQETTSQGLNDGPICPALDLDV